MDNKPSIAKPVDGWEERVTDLLNWVAHRAWNVAPVLNAFAYRSHVHAMTVEEVFPLPVCCSPIVDDDAPPSRREMERDKQRRKQHAELLDVTDEDREEVAQAIKDIDAATVVLNHDVRDALPLLIKYVRDDRDVVGCEWVAAIDAFTSTAASLAVFLSGYLNDQPTHDRGSLRLKHDRNAYLAEIDRLKTAIRGLFPLMRLASTAAGTVRVFAVTPSESEGAELHRKGRTVSELRAATRKTDRTGKPVSGTEISLSTFARARARAGILDVPNGKLASEREYTPDETARIVAAMGSNKKHSEWAETCYCEWARRGWLPDGYSPPWVTTRRESNSSTRQVLVTSRRAIA